MTKTKVTVTPISKSKVDTLPNSWTGEDYKHILDAFSMEAEGLSESEVYDYLLMSIADNTPRESAEIVLTYALGAQLNSGQIQNLANEMAAEKIWEEYPDILMHKDLFKVNQLLFKAYNGKFPRGHALKLAFEIHTSAADMKTIESNSCDALLKLVIGGTEEHSIFHRLYDHAIQEGVIEDAKGIIWYSTIQMQSPEEAVVEVYSSDYWLDDFIADQPYEILLDLGIY